MTIISTDYGQGLTTQAQQGLEQLSNAEKREQGLTGPDGDLVDISDEAKELLATKAKERGADTPAALGPPPEVPESESTGEDGEGLGGGLASSSQDPSGTASSNAAAGSGPTNGSSPEEDDDETDTEDLENQIDTLEQEIATLKTQTQSNPDAEEQIKIKETEKTVLESELSMLELQQDDGQDA